MSRILAVVVLLLVIHETLGFSMTGLGTNLVSEVTDINH